MTASLEFRSDSELDAHLAPGIRIDDELALLSEAGQNLRVLSYGRAAMYLEQHADSPDTRDVQLSTDMAEVAEMRDGQNNAFMNIMQTRADRGQAYNAFHTLRTANDRPKIEIRVASFVLALFSEPEDIDDAGRQSRFRNEKQMIANAKRVDSYDDASPLIEDLAIVAGRFAENRNGSGKAESRNLDQVAEEIMLHDMIKEVIRRMRVYGADETVIDAFISRIDVDPSQSKMEETDALIASLLGRFGMQAEATA